jgi:hypothetical protein
MKNVITKSESSRRVGEPAVYLFDDWFDPIEAGVRDRERGFKAAGIHNIAEWRWGGATVRGPSAAAQRHEASRHYFAPKRANDERFARGPPDRARVERAYVLSRLPALWSGQVDKIIMRSSRRVFAGIGAT